GLVVVLRLRLDDQNIEVPPPPEQARRRRNSCGAAAYDHDIMGFPACLRRCAGHVSLPCLFCARLRSAVALHADRKSTLSAVVRWAGLDAEDATSRALAHERGDDEDETS